MKGAVAAVPGYLPPDPTRIQATKDAGCVTLRPQPGWRVRLTFADYLKAGDSLGLDVGLATNRPLEAQVSSYLDSQQEPVTLDVQFATLDHRATSPATIVREAKAKNLSVKVQNSGCRRAAN